MSETEILYGVTTREMSGTRRALNPDGFEFVTVSAGSEARVTETRTAGLFHITSQGGVRLGDYLTWAQVCDRVAPE